MKVFNLDRAKDRYDAICFTHLVEEASTYENPSWNIRDIVAEADYWLGTFYDDGHCHSMLLDKYDPDYPENIKEWRSATGKLKRFIAAYAPFIEDVICTENHGSARFDNHPGI